MVVVACSTTTGMEEFLTLLDHRILLWYLTHDKAQDQYEGENSSSSQRGRGMGKSLKNEALWGEGHGILGLHGSYLKLHYKPSHEMGPFVRTTWVLSFLLVLTALGQTDSADASKVDILYNHFTFQTIILVDCLWVLSFFLILVYTAEIKRHIVSKLWDYVSIGQILFLIGIIFIQASIFSTPVDQIFATEEAARFMMGWAKIILLFAIVIAGILFFVEWLAIFNITPTIASINNLPYLGLSILLTMLGTTLPIYWHPTIVFGPEVLCCITNLFSAPIPCPLRQSGRPPS